jgi:integrase
VLRVIGTGRKEREVPVPIEVVSELATYLEARGLDPDAEDIGNQGGYLLGKASDADERAPGLSRGGRFDPREGIAATTLYDQVKRFFADCADVRTGQGDTKGADRLARSSTHWLRHSHASHAIAAGMPIEIAQQNLAHASLATTTVLCDNREEAAHDGGREFLEEVDWRQRDCLRIPALIPIRSAHASIGPVALKIGLCAIAYDNQYWAGFIIEWTNDCERKSPPGRGQAESEDSSQGQGE